jgi:hypothetical protein
MLSASSFLEEWDPDIRHMYKIAREEIGAPFAPFVDTSTVPLDAFLFKFPVEPGESTGEGPRR